MLNNFGKIITALNQDITASLIIGKVTRTPSDALGVAVELLPSGIEISGERLYICSSVLAETKRQIKIESVKASFEASDIEIEGSKLVIDNTIEDIAGIGVGNAIKVPRYVAKIPEAGTATAKAQLNELEIEGVMTYKSTLKVGDMVALIRTDAHIYLLIDKLGTEI